MISKVKDEALKSIIQFMHNLHTKTKRWLTWSTHISEQGIFSQHKSLFPSNFSCMIAKKWFQKDKSTVIIGIEVDFILF